MASLNRVSIIGRLGNDPELRYTANQLPRTTFSVATSEFRNTQNGEKSEKTEWHRIVVWGRQAETCSKFLAKGRPVFIEGKLQTRSWEDKTGAKRFTTEIVAHTVQFLGARDSREEAVEMKRAVGDDTQPLHLADSARSDDSAGAGLPGSAVDSEEESDESDFAEVPF